MKIAFLDIPVVALILFFLISTFASIDRWASFAGSFGVWHDGFFVFFLQIFWYFFAARFLKLGGIWRFGFVLPILFMFLLGVLAKSFLVAFFGLAALLFFHIARKSRGQGELKDAKGTLNEFKGELPQGGEILLLALLFALLGLLGAFPIATLVPLQDSFLEVLASWKVTFSSLLDSPKNFFFGTGPATFSLDVARYSYLGAELPSGSSAPSIPGSGFASILATLGVIGFVLYLLVFVLAFLRFAFLVFEKHDRMQGFFGALLFAVFGAYLLSPATLPLSFLFWTLAGFAREKTYIIPKITNPFWKLGTLLLAGFVLFMGFRTIGAHAVYQKAKTESDTGKRISLLKTAEKINPHEPAYKIQLGRLYIEIAKKGVQQGNPSPEAVKAVENALAHLQEAVKTGPARPEAWEALGMLYKEIQGAPGAKEWGVKAFETALTLSPKNPWLYTELGMFYTQKEEFDLAEKQFKKALSVSPNFFDALLQLALLEEKKGNTDLALSILEKLIQQDVSQPAILFQLGRIYYNVGKLEDAERAFKQVLLLNPHDSNTHYALGTLYEKEKRKKEAIEAFEKVLELNPGDSNVIVKLNQLKNK